MAGAPPAQGGRLYIGTDIDAVAAAEIRKPVAHLLSEEQENPHMTFQWCGLDVDDATAHAIADMWEDAFASLDEHDKKYTFASNFELFGEKHDTLVLKLSVTPALEDLVKQTRARVLEKFPNLPPSDFDFSPHLTLGKGEQLPASDITDSIIARLSGYEHRIDTLFVWRENYQVFARFDV